MLYAIQSPKVQHEILISEGTGSTVSNLRIPLIENLEMPCPSLATQKAIGQILRNLDDRIELLRSMNETLEAMARAFFKSWFIDFDPVHKKAEGQPTGLPPEIDALFPDSFVDSELGEIPKGWETSTLDKIAYLSTKSISPQKSPTTLYEHYSIPAYDDSRMPLLEYGESIKSNKYLVTRNSVLVSKLNPETPRIWLPFNVKDSSICSTEFMQFVPYGNIQKYLLLLLGSCQVYDEILKRVTGSTGSRQRAQPSQIAVLPIIAPPKNLVSLFNESVSPTIDAICSNKIEISTLTRLRDSLLPRLISGEIELSDKDISKIMEPAK
jgi:type I restriction enzyme S subunit